MHWRLRVKWDTNWCQYMCVISWATELLCVCLLKTCSKRWAARCSRNSAMSTHFWQTKRVTVQASENIWRCRCLVNLSLPSSCGYWGASHLCLCSQLYVRTCWCQRRIIQELAFTIIHVSRPLRRPSLDVAFLTDPAFLQCKLYWQFIQLYETFALYFCITTLCDIYIYIYYYTEHSTRSYWFKCHD